MKSEINLGVGFVLGAMTVILFSIFRKDGNRPGRILGDFQFVDPDSQIKITTTGVFKMELKEGQKVRVKAQNFRTRRGNAATIEAGSGRWTSSDESVVSATPDPNDETQCDFEGLDGSGNESIVAEFRADGRPGEGVKEIVMSGAITCTQGDAAVGDLEFGEPVDVETGGATNGGGESQTIGAGEVGDASEVLGGGASSGAGGEANQGVESNPSAGSGAGQASGTTAPSESDQPADQGGAIPTIQEAGSDTAERNADSDRQSDNG